MIRELSFTIQGTPVGAPRPRFARGHAYMPSDYMLYKAKVAAIFRKLAVSCKFETCAPVYSVYIEAHHRVPPSYTKARRRNALRGLLAPGKPDVDNLAKGIMDALNRNAYSDDVRVCDLHVRKVFDPDSNFVIVRVSYETTDRSTE